MNHPYEDVINIIVSDREQLSGERDENKKIVGDIKAVLDFDVEVWFSLDFEEYIIKNPTNIVVNKKKIKSEIVKEISMLLEKGAKRKEIIAYGPVWAVGIYSNSKLREVTQIKLKTNEPFLAVEQNQLRFKFTKDLRAYELFICTDNPESTILVFRSDSRFSTAQIAKARNIKATLRRDNKPGEYIVNIWSKNPTLIAGYVRLAQDVYKNEESDSIQAYGALWKNRAEDVYIDLIDNKIYSEKMILSRWYVPSKYCRVLKRIFELWAREDTRSKISFVYENSNLISLVLGAVGLTSRSAGLITLIVGTIMNVGTPTTIFYKMIEELEKVTGFRLEVEYENNFKNGCCLQYTKRIELKDLPKEEKYETDFYYEILPWKDDALMESPEGELGEWTDGKTYMYEIEKNINELEEKLKNSYIGRSEFETEDKL